MIATYATTHGTVAVYDRTVHALASGGIVLDLAMVERHVSTMANGVTADDLVDMIVEHVGGNVDLSDAASDALLEYAVACMAVVYP